MRAAALLLLVALAACQRPAATGTAPRVASRPAPAAAVNADPGVRTYRCEDGATLEAGYPDRNTAVVKLRDHSYTLKAQVAASGVRYVGYGVQWWTRGLSEGRLSRLKPGETIASDPGVTCHAKAEPPVEPPAPGTPGGLPDDRRPISEAPFAPTSAQGAADVVQHYYAFLEADRFAEAQALWSAGSPDRPHDGDALAARCTGIAEYHAQIGGPGRIEGAAGSLYVDVPVVIYGRRQNGQALHDTATVTLRRVNDVPGSTGEQRLWRIYRIAPGGAAFQR